MRRGKAAGAVCLYRRLEGIWTIPLYLRDALPRHRFNLLSHFYECHEFVFHAASPATGAPVI